MNKRRRGLALLLALCAVFPVIYAGVPAAEAVSEEQLVGTALLYVKNSAGDSVLVAQTPVDGMEADLKAGVINDTLYNYSVFDHQVTVLHQEAQGFTVPEYIAYAQARSSAPALREAELTFASGDTMCFRALDDPVEDAGRQDTYTWDELYGVQRYNYSLLYQYWDYTAQDYYDPAGEMTREEVLDYLQGHAEETQFILSVNAFSQRYTLTDEKYKTGDFDMENYWYDSGLLDSVRTFRMMMSMTEANLRAENLRKDGETAHLTRYGIWELLLDMENAPDIEPLGAVAAPTAVMTEDNTYYYIRFQCETPGAAIYYNHHYRMADYLPTCEYTQAVALPKQYFPDGVVTMNAHAVQDGYTDAGVVTLTLTASGQEEALYSDVDREEWYFPAVDYVTSTGLFDPTGEDTFSPAAPMTRLMLAQALYRLAGSQPVEQQSPFTDCDETAVIWCYENGVVNGETPTAFAPGKSITREQIAVMFRRYMDLFERTQATGDLSVFTDAAEISDYAVDAMAWAVGRKLINGMGGGLLVPQGTATRAEAAQLLLNFSG